MKEYKAILFDVDGTLIDSFTPVAYCFRKTLEAFQIPYTEEQIMLGYGMTDPEFIRFMGVDPDSIDGKRFWEMECYYYKEAVEQITLYPGVEEEIRKLHNQNYLLGIVTSRSRKDLMEEACLKPILPYFDAYVTREDTEHHKPDKEPMELILKNLGISKEEALYVGDLMQDYECAKNAGVDFVLTKWAKQPLPISLEEKEQ